MTYSSIKAMIQVAIKYELIIEMIHNLKEQSFFSMNRCNAYYLK